MTATCPRCGSAAIVANGRRKMTLADLPAGGRPRTVIVEVQVMICRACGKTHRLDPPGKAAGMRITERLRVHIAARTAAGAASRAIAAEVGISHPACQRAAKLGTKKVDGARFRGRL